MSCQQRAWKNVVERGSGRLARASSTASGNVRTALWRCEAPKNRVSARSRRAHVVAASMTRASSARKCQVEKSNTRQKNLSAETRGMYLSTTALGELRTRLTRTRWTPMLRGARIRVPDGSRASFCSSGGARGVQIHGRRVFTFGAFDVLLNPRSTNENDEPNEQMCQVGPELVWRGSFYSRIKGLHARTLRNVVDFFFAGESKKISCRNASSSAASVGG